MPRFVSLKSDRVNMRKGPGTDYPTAWVYRRAGLPLEVIKEFEGWRQVRDADGAAGWVLQSFLSGRRTALVLPWEVKPGSRRPGGAARRRQRALAPRRHGRGRRDRQLASCDGRWCHVSIDKFRGYIEQKKLWGVYEGEVIEVAARPDRSAVSSCGHQPDDHVDVADLHSFGRLRHAFDADGIAGDVVQLAVRLDEEVVVVRGVGIEVGLEPLIASSRSSPARLNWCSVL